MIQPWFELVKVTALAALVGIAVSLILSPHLSALVAVAALWLLLARIT